MRCICGRPVYGAKVHLCCARNGPECKACAASDHLETVWLRVSTICDTCDRRSRFHGPTCPSCLRDAA